MDRGSLRSVPLRPPGPVAPAEAARHVGAALPELDEVARRALALVEIAGRSRADAAAILELDGEATAEALTRARKALRRSIFPLAASGWCERAERLLSDRLDGALEAPGDARLDAHLRHCGRCVEHERRLAHARETLVRDYIEAHGPPEPEPTPEPAAPVELRIVQHEAVAAEPEPVEAVEPAAAGPEPVEAGAAEPDPGEPAAAELAPAEPAAVPAAPPEPRPPASAGQGGAVWTALYAVGIALAVIAVLLTVLAATGAIERVF